MKVLIATDSFKGSIEAKAVCESLKAGIEQQNEAVEVLTHPMADGGDGTLNVLKEHLEAQEVKMFAKNPLFKTITTSYLRKEDAAYIEMASASGLSLIKPTQRNPEFTTSYGTGQLIKHAVKNGCKRIYLFVGGSATNDAGIGIGQALGYKFLDKNGEELLTIGESLSYLTEIIPPENPLDFELFVATDVENSLFGESGAAYVYAEQKGADPAMVERLDRGLQNFAKVVKSSLGKDIADIAGAGAAGGAAGGVIAFFAAKVLSGISTLINLTGLEAKIGGLDLVISGEGSLDKQTFSGKVIEGVSRLAKTRNLPLWVVCGVNKLNTSETVNLGIDKVYSIMEVADSQEDAMQNAAQYLTEIGNEIGAWMLKPMECCFKALR